MKNMEMPDLGASKKEQNTTNEKEISKENDSLENFMIPEGWIEDISETEKEAYRIKVIALGVVRPAESNSGLFESNYKGIPPARTVNDLTARDYESAKEVYKEFFEDKFKRPGDKGLDKVVSKIVDATGGNIIRAYVELRARIMAKQEREALNRDNK